jgi:hypothetical protein
MQCDVLQNAAFFHISTLIFTQASNDAHELHNRSCLIDISWLDWAYKSSTCDVMYRRRRRHLYYGGQI